MKRHSLGNRKTQTGFTLVELVMVIVIMGVIGGVVAVFMKSPIDAYFATARRAGLTDAADTVVQRINLDTRRALPNSVRVTGTQCVDLIPVKTSGFYRVNGLHALTFSPATANAFNMLGANTATISVNDLVVVYNPGTPGPDAYTGNNVATISGVADAGLTPVETTLTITPTVFPTASPVKRFQVVAAGEQVVSYACTAQGTMLRAVNTSALTQNCLPAGGVSASATVHVMVKNLSACSFQYTSNPMNTGVLQVTMQLTDSSDSVDLQHRVNMDTTP